MTVLAALIPVLVLIGLGYSLQQWRMVSDEAWAGMEKLAYYIFFPALLINTLARQTLTGLPWAEILTVVIATTYHCRYGTDHLATVLSEYERSNVHVGFSGRRSV